MIPHYKFQPGMTLRVSSENVDSTWKSELGLIQVVAEMLLYQTA